MQNDDLTEEQTDNEVVKTMPMSAMEIRKAKRDGWTDIFRYILAIREHMQKIHEIDASMADHEEFRNAPVPAFSLPNPDVKVERLRLEDMPDDRLVVDQLPPGDTEMHRKCKVGKYGKGRDYEQLVELLEYSGISRHDEMIPEIFQELGIGKEDEIYQIVLGKSQEAVSVDKPT